MALFKPGTVFRYRVATELYCMGKGPVYDETYTVLEVGEDRVRVRLESERDGESVLETDQSHGSYIFPLAHLKRIPGPPIQLELQGHLVYVDKFESDACDLVRTVYLGRDGVVYREDSSGWMCCAGEECSRSSRLLSISVNGVTYDDIKWVEEPEEVEEYDTESLFADDLKDFRGRFC